MHAQALCTRTAEAALTYMLQYANGGSQFALTQFGLSAFVWSQSENQYRARTFNFYVFPHSSNGYDRRFLSQVLCSVRIALAHAHKTLVMTAMHPPVNCVLSNFLVVRGADSPVGLLWCM